MSPRPNGSVPTLEWLEARCIRMPSTVAGLGDCWLWQMQLNSDGYARVTISGRETSTHRLAYELVHGPIHCWLILDHLCRVRGCINPEHGEPVTQTENTRRGMSPSAISNRTGECKCGHKLEPVGGRWRCKVCLAQRQHEFYLRKKARLAATPTAGQAPGGGDRG